MIFEQVAQSLLTPAHLTQVIETDGDLELSEITMELAEYLERQVWGQGFPQPTFSAQFHVESQRIVGEKHLKLKLRKRASANANLLARHAETYYDAILFFQSDPLPDVIDAVYRLQVNEFNGKTTLQLLLEHWSDVEHPTTDHAS